MTEEDIKQRIQAGLKMKTEGTFNDEDLAAYILTLCKDVAMPGDKHKDQMERLLHKTRELIEMQFKFFSGNKTVLSKCKTLEKELWHKTEHLLKSGYNIDRFIQKPPTQQKLI